VDKDGLVEPIKPYDQLPDSPILRFDIVPPDQRTLSDGEFLVVALFCKQSRGPNTALSLGKSFMFKVIPSELVDDAKKRIATLGFFEESLLPWVQLRANNRILNGDEPLDLVLEPGHLLKIALPDGGRSLTVLRREAGSRGRNRERDSSDN
jgi:hypothetical protein